jgi:hypothetical protein
MVTDKGSLSGIGVESLQGTMKNPAIWFADTLGVRNQDGVKHRCESQAFQLATLHSNGAICDQPELEAGCAKGRKCLRGISEEHTRFRKSSALIVQQNLSQARPKLEPRDHAREQLLSWTIAVAIEPYKGLDVLLRVYSLEEVRKTFPLTSNKPLEASTTVQQSSVEIEDHGLNIR